MTSVLLTRRTTQLPKCWSCFFASEKCSIPRHLAVADDHVGLAGEDRRDQLRDVGAHVLVVGVGVDDDVGAELQAGVEPRLETRREPLVVGQPDDVLDAAFARHRDRAIGRAVVDHEQLDRVESGEGARQVGDRRRQRLFLVQAGDLDDQLQGGAQSTGGGGRSVARID